MTFEEAMDFLMQKATAREFNDMPYELSDMAAKLTSSLQVLDMTTFICADVLSRDVPQDKDHVLCPHMQDALNTISLSLLFQGYILGWLMMAEHDFKPPSKEPKPGDTEGSEEELINKEPITKKIQ